MEPNPPPADDTEAKGDAKRFLERLLPFAEQMLQKHREFYPFGAGMSPDGTIHLEGAATGEQRPSSHELIDLLRKGHRQAARAGKIRSCAIVFDMRVVPPGRTEKQDAIAAAVDHFSGYSGIIIFPYTFDAAQKLRLEAPYAVKGANEIFGPQA